MNSATPSKAKSRMVTFRLTAGEYQKCREHCLERGIGSISNLARTAIDRLLHHSDPPASVTLESRVTELESHIQNLLQQIHLQQTHLQETQPSTKQELAEPVFLETYNA